MIMQSMYLKCFLSGSVAQEKMCDIMSPAEAGSLVRYKFRTVDIGPV